MRYFRDKQATPSHPSAISKLYPEFKYTLFVTGIFTEWAVGEFYGFDRQRNRVVVYGGPDASVGVTSIPEYVPLGFSVVHLEGSWVLILVFSIARSLSRPSYSPSNRPQPRAPDARSVSRKRRLRFMVWSMRLVRPEEFGTRDRTKIRLKQA